MESCWVDKTFIWNSSLIVWVFTDNNVIFNTFALD